MKAERHKNYARLKSRQVLLIVLVVFAAISLGKSWSSGEETANNDQRRKARLPAEVVACKKPGGMCTIHPLLMFESKSAAYYVGYIEESRRLPSGALRPPDSMSGHQIPMPHSQEDFHDTDHYSLYRLCYDQVHKDGTNECREVIQPQPEIGQIHPELANAKRAPYNLLIADMKKELGADKNEYLTVSLWLQQDPKLGSDTWDGTGEGPKAKDVSSPIHDWKWNLKDQRYFILRYRFIDEGNKAFFEAGEDTRDTIKRIYNKTLLKK